MSLILALLAVGLAPPPALAREASRAAETRQTEPDFKGEAASGDARKIAQRALAGDSRNLPFVIVDKRDAKVFLFDRAGRLLGAAPALLGLGKGDETVPGIGQRRLATITPAERTTPAGRFQAALGHDFEQDILWVDYESALSLHRVITGNPSDRRRQRLATATPRDNRISYGCINVPAAFYDKVVIPAFTGTVGIVYILPEVKSLGDVFPIK